MGKHVDGVPVGLLPVRPLLFARALVDDAFRVGSHAWWLGWLCALCGLFTVAGGVVLPAIIAGVAVLKVMNPPRRWRELVVTLGVAGVVLSAGVLAASPPPRRATNR